MEPYDAKSASEVKPIFQRILTEDKGLIISSEGTGYKVSSLYIKLSAGLRNLAIMDPSGFGELKKKIKFKRTKNTVEIHLNKASLINNVAGTIESVDNIGDWKKSLGESVKGEGWGFRKIAIPLTLSNEDIKYIEDTCSSNGVEFLIKGNELRMTK